MSIRALGHSAQIAPAAASRAGGYLMLCLALLTLSSAVFGNTATDSREYQIKAAFLYNFTRFTEWPAGSFADASSPIAIGTYCAEPFSGMLEKLVKSRAVNGRKIAVTRLDSADAARTMHVVFVCADSEALLPDIAEAVGSSPVLTVSETNRSAASVACIDFHVDDGRVRFEINMTASEHAGLQISAQLQKLAIAVRRTP
jgi:hypothetical protein